MSLSCVRMILIGFRVFEYDGQDGDSVKDVRTMDILVQNQ